MDERRIIPEREKAHRDIYSSSNVVLADYGLLFVTRVFPHSGIVFFLPPLLSSFASSLRPPAFSRFQILPMFPVPRRLSHCQHRNTASPPSPLPSLFLCPFALQRISLFYPVSLRRSSAAFCDLAAVPLSPHVVRLRFQRTATGRFAPILQCIFECMRRGNGSTPLVSGPRHTYAHRREMWKIMIDRRRRMGARQYYGDSLNESPICFRFLLLYGSRNGLSTKWRRVHRSICTSIVPRSKCGRKCSCSNCFYDFPRTVFVCNI